VHVRLRLDGKTLTVLAGKHGAGFEVISERSDGLRQFVALFAFLSREGIVDSDNIVLTDEVETHLHYDAQADLVQMLARQKLARQVIYTTHSIGALPEDLGLGVRLIQPSAENASEIINKFWAQNTRGLSPVLIGMGAATMAFLPVRYCLLTEGSTDMLLLPALIREATRKEALLFQISPGLSEASDRQIAILRNEGRRVLYLVDGDDGGDSIRTKLRRAGVPDEEIISLNDVNPSVVEDYIKKEIYHAAVNEELRRSGHKSEIFIQEMPDHLRPTFVTKWCEANGVKQPNKVDVAYRALEQLEEGEFTEPARAEELRVLYEKIVRVFHGPS